MIEREGFGNLLKSKPLDPSTFEEWLGSETCEVHQDESANKNAWYGWQASRKATAEEIFGKIRERAGNLAGSMSIEDIGMIEDLAAEIEREYVKE